MTAACRPRRPGRRNGSAGRAGAGTLHSAGCGIAQECLRCRDRPWRRCRRRGGCGAGGNQCWRSANEMRTSTGLDPGTAAASPWRTRANGFRPVARLQPQRGGRPARIRRGCLLPTAPTRPQRRTAGRRHLVAANDCGGSSDEDRRRPRSRRERTTTAAGLDQRGHPPVDAIAVCPIGTGTGDLRDSAGAEHVRGSRIRAPSAPGSQIPPAVPREPEASRSVSRRASTRMGPGCCGAAHCRDLAGHRRCRCTEDRPGRRQGRHGVLIAERRLEAWSASACGRGARLACGFRPPRRWPRDRSRGPGSPQGRGPRYQARCRTRRAPRPPRGTCPARVPEP